MDKFKKATSVAALGILAGATAIGTKAVQIASDTAESTSKVQTLLGKSSTAAMDFANTSATAFGMSKREALGSVGSMAAVQVAMGASKAEAAKLSVEYTQLSADLGSFNNASSADVQEALTASLSGEYEMLKKYGIVVNDTTLAAEAQRIGMTKHGATWDSAQKKQLSYNIIMASTKAAQGDFARTSGGLANQSKIMSARMEDLQGKIGAKLLPAVVAVAGKFNELLGWMEKHKTTTKVLATIVGGLAVAIVATAVALKAYALAQKIAALGGRALYTAAFRLNLAFLANPVVLVVAGLIALGVAFVVAYKKSETFRNIVNGAMSAVKNFFVAAWDKMRFTVGRAIQLIGGMYITFADGVLGVFEMMARGLGKLPKILGGGVGDKAAEAIAGIRNGLDSLKRKLDEIPTSKSIHFNANVESALQNIEMLKRAQAGLGTSTGGVDLTSTGGQVQGHYGGMRARGGPVSAGTTYLVGETGPELFLAGKSGLVIPNNKIGGAGTGGMTDKAKKAAADRMQAFTDTITAKVEKMKAAVQKAKDVATEIRGAFKDMTNVTSLDMGSQTSFAAMRVLLEKRASAAMEFARSITTLRSRGLNATTLKQLTDAGPDSLASVQALLSGGKAGITDTNRLVGQINAAGTGLGNREAIARTGTDPDAKGLAVIGKGKQAVRLDINLNGEADALTDAIVKALRKKIREKGGNVQLVLGVA